MAAKTKLTKCKNCGKEIELISHSSMYTHKKTKDCNCRLYAYPDFEADK
jgi:hypothetical protein